MLNTAAARRTKRRQARVTIGRRRRVASFCRRPTRLRPPIWIFWSSKPASGTSLPSMPRSVPTKTGWWPRFSSSRATAIAGITCPPVPPPAMMNVLPGMFGDIHQHAEEREGAHQRAASIADEGRGDAFGRAGTEHDAHVDEALDDDDDGRAEGQIAAEVVIHAPGGAEASPEDHAEAEEDDAGADEAEFLTDDGVDKVGVGLGEVEELLLAVHQAGAEESAGADRDLRLLGLVVGISCGERLLHVGPDGAALVEAGHQGVVAVDEVDDSGETVGLAVNGNAESEEGDAGGDGAVAEFQAGDE